MMREAQSSKLNAESSTSDIRTIDRKNLVSFLHSTFCFKLLTFSFLLIAFCFSCSSASKEDSKDTNADTWQVTISGKVGFPQQGQITIQEIKNGSLGWSDTVKLKSNYTYSKRVKLSQPGYYKITFFGRQYVDFILYPVVSGNAISGAGCPMAITFILSTRPIKAFA